MVRKKVMTESEWLASDNSYEMLPTSRAIIREHPRKGRLFAVACCYRIWPHLDDERSRVAVEAAASFADGLVSEEELATAEKAAQAAHADVFKLKGKVDASAEWAAQFAASPDEWFAASRASNFAYVAAGDGILPGPEHVAQSHLLRCIFGNPFRPVTINTAWLRPNVVALAQTIYYERAFDRLKELADALVAVGCDSLDILNHCRSKGPHVRGCWVVDTLLGRP